MHVVIDVLFALFAFDLIKGRLRNVDPARPHQLRHLPEEKGEQQSANVRAVDIGIGHNNDSAVAQLRDIKISFLLTVAILFRLADSSADGRDHRLNLVVL